MPQLIHELAKIDRKAALIFNRQIRLLNTKGKLKFNWITNPDTVSDLSDLVDSFNWKKSSQGYNYWDSILTLTKGE